jgi:hypothetical protein
MWISPASLRNDGSISPWAREVHLLTICGGASCSQRRAPSLPCSRWPLAASACSIRSAFSSHLPRTRLQEIERAIVIDVAPRYPASEPVLRYLIGYAFLVRYIEEGYILSSRGGATQQVACSAVIGVPSANVVAPAIAAKDRYITTMAAASRGSVRPIDLALIRTHTLLYPGIYQLTQQTCYL